MGELFALHPHVLTVPSVWSASGHEPPSAPPIAMAVTFARPGTMVGALAAAPGRPSRPPLLSPKQYTSPPRTAHVAQSYGSERVELYVVSRVRDRSHGWALEQARVSSVG